MQNSPILTICFNNENFRPQISPKLPEFQNVVVLPYSFDHESSSTEFMKSVNTPYVTFLEKSQSFNSEAIPQIITLINESEPLDLLITLSHHTDNLLLNCWEEFPLELACLVKGALGSARLFFEKSVLERDSFFGEAFNPLQAAAIRLMSSKHHVVMAEPMDIGEQARVDPPSLVPSKPAKELHWLKDYLYQFPSRPELAELKSEPDLVAFQAGLFQIYDDLETSHELSQSVQGQGKHVAGDYWHGIMHRREPDYSNAKYWFRRVGEQPLYSLLAEQSEQYFLETHHSRADHWQQRLCGRQGWDPLAFIDFCEDAFQTQDLELIRLAEKIQWTEMLLLLQQNYQDFM